MEWLALPLGYLLGSIPFGLLVGFAAGKDVRTEGSGNIGFTNVLRVCGAGWGAPVLALDILKGVAPVAWIAPALGGGDRPGVLVLAGLCAILGHNFPVWLKFKGGKGVATSAGVVLALMWQPFLAALAAWVLVVLVSRYISLGSMVAAVVLVAAQVFLSPDPLGRDLPYTLLAGVLAVLVVVRHKGNIARLRAGTENRLGAKKTGDAAPPEGEASDAEDSSS